MKAFKQVMIGCAALVAVFVLTWCICTVWGRNYYNYKGYVVDIVEENGDIVIVTLSGNVESRFTLKWYSRKKYEKEDKSIAIGDIIRLSTTHYSDTNIKKLSVKEGYSLEGKVFFVSSDITERPFLFVNDPLYGTYMFDMVSFDRSIFDGMDTGDVVRVYYAHSFAPSVISAQIEGAVKLADGSFEDFSEAEKNYISDHGYTIKEPTDD